MRPRFVLVLAALIGAAVLAAWRPGRAQIGFGSVRQLWSDILRDADQPGMRLTRLTNAEEMALGDTLAAQMGGTRDPEAQQRVEDVAARMLPFVRRKGIRYRFAFIDAPMPNAFALPGGRILVTRAMVDFVRSDSELAEIVGHEIAHVDLRHVVERYQYQYRLGSLAELAHRLATMPFSADQELDADADGLRLLLSAGYDAAAAPEVFEHLARELREPESEPSHTPTGELADAIEGAFWSYFQTHPPSAERARRLGQYVAPWRP